MLPAAMLPAAGAKAHALVATYRELLLRLRASAAGGGGGGAAAADEPVAALLLAKQRALLRLRRQQYQVRALRLDPLGALRRRLLWARSGLRELRARREERLRGLAAALDAPRPAGAAAADDAEVLQSPVFGSDGLARRAVFAAVGGACKAFLAGAVTTTVEGAAAMEAALARPAGQPLITVSNHVSAADDPLVTVALLPGGALLRPAQLRWTLCATDRCFSRGAALSAFFRAAKVLPVERGAGVDQPGMHAAAARVNAGDWAHIFVEGTRAVPKSAGGDGRMLPTRRGVGWLVAACETPPLVLPFVHSGMEGVLPRGAALPRPGGRLRVLVGEPVEVADLAARAAAERWPARRLEDAVVERVGRALAELKARLDGVAVEDVAPAREAAAAAAGDELLLPLLDEEELEARRRRWAARRWLPPLTQRLREGVAASGARVAAKAELVHETLRALRGEGARALEALGPAAAARDEPALATARSLAQYSRDRLRHVRSLLALPPGAGGQPAPALYWGSALASGEG